MPDMRIRTGADKSVRLWRVNVKHPQVHLVAFLPPYGPSQVGRLSLNEGTCFLPISRASACSPDPRTIKPVSGLAHHITITIHRGCVAAGARERYCGG
jgi:hypothetical protein